MNKRWLALYELALILVCAVVAACGSTSRAGADTGIRGRILLGDTCPSARQAVSAAAPVTVSAMPGHYAAVEIRYDAGVR